MPAEKSTPLRQHGNTTNGSTKTGWPQPEWLTSPDLTSYDSAITTMQQRIAAIHQHQAGELLWLLEHPPVYTAGTSAQPEDLINPGNAIIRRTGRGGQWTWHGPGQRVIYIMLDLRKRGQDVRRFVNHVEEWAIRSLGLLGLEAHRRAGHPGVWLDAEDNAAPPEKIAAIGIRISRWVSWHGMAINCNPDLGAFDGIIPCGIREGGVTSLADRGINADMAALDEALRASFNQVFQ